MQKRRLGQSELEVTVLTMGCWQAGGAEWGEIDDEESIGALRAALDSGINFFDTAEVYGDGHSERMVARALEGRRDEVMIASKVGAHNLAADKVHQACDNSLKNLQTDRIDLYQVHWPSGSWGSPIVPIAETMSALNELQAAGKIRAIGVSNFNGEQIEEALQYGHIDSLQPPHSLFFRPFETNGTVATCLQHQMGVIPYSPLAQGLLTGKFNRDNRPTDDNRAGNALFQGEHYERALAAVDALKPIAQKYGKTTGQLSLQWLLTQDSVASVIVGARNAAQVKDNVLSADFEIDAADIEEIDRIGRTVSDALPVEKTNMWA